MQRRGALLVLFSVSILFLQGQNKRLFWERLKKDTSEHILINPDLEFPETDWDSTLKPKFVLPLKAGNDVYAWVGGTGRMYKLEAGDSLGYRFKRIDSTEALLYNINAFPFVYKKRVYTLGGGGIWRTNGQLRLFNETAHEWDIVKLNKEIPFLWSKEDGCIWYNPKAGKIYIGFYKPFNDAVKEEFKPVPEVYELNLETKEWKKLGALNKAFVTYINRFRNIAMSPNGLLCLLDAKVYLFNFEENRIYRLRDNIPYWQLLNNWFNGSTFYFKDSVLYAHNARANLFDSVRIRTTDFEKDAVPLYSKERSGFFYFYFLLAIVTGLGLLLFFFIRYRKTNTSINNDAITLDSFENPQLSSAELEIVKLIYTNSKNGMKTTIDELNTLMGLSKKNTDIQKKQRSDMLIALNRKLAKLSENNNPVIDKIRSEADGRMFEYFIDGALMDKAAVVIERNATQNE